MKTPASRASSYHQQLRSAVALAAQEAGTAKGEALRAERGPMSYTPGAGASTMPRAA